MPIRIRTIAWSALGIAAITMIGMAAALAALPPERSHHIVQPVPAEESAATIRALQPSGRRRPVVAIIGINKRTEVTDYVMPYGILRRADVADVYALATGPGPIELYPALKVEPDASIAGFDRKHPDGADYVIVPAMEPENDEAALAWIKSQASKGAIVIGVCVGAKVLAGTGLLDGHDATTHWYSLDDMLSDHPAIRHVPDRRFLVDGRVATTTGISASMPMSLTLIEAIAGTDKAAAVAADLGIEHWDARHDSAAFEFTRSFAMTAIRNRLSVWNWETLGVELTTGMDEVSLALAVDAWSRTYRSRALTFAEGGAVILSKSGLRIIPDGIAPGWPDSRISAAILALKPAATLDATLDEIATRYRPDTASFVAKQLEYPWSPASD